MSLVKEPANSRGGAHHAALGIGIGENASSISLSQGARAILSQEVRSPRAGRFTFTVHACGAGSTSEFYREVFLKNFVCRLVIFGFLDLKKDHRQQRVFAAYDFQPTWCEAGQPKYDRFQVSATLRSQDGGAMETSRGIGAAVIVEKVSPGVLELPVGATGVSPVRGPQAFIRIDDVELVFNPRPRDESVTV